MLLAIAEVLPLLVSSLCTLLLSLLDILCINFASHDAVHLVVDLRLLLLVNLPSLEGVHLDEHKPAEELLVVDGFVATFKEMVLVRVVVSDEGFHLGRLLMKEGASMRDDLPFVIDERAGDEDLSECVAGHHVVLDELLETQV
jgi:hypothetical protein